MNKYINKYLKCLRTQKSSDGFTLIELLVAASITTIVVGLTGFGVVAITSKNKEAKAESERRVELNRALDFIADEVRQAKPIATNASGNLSTVAPGFNSSGKTPVLTLQIPGVSQRVIYYIESSSSPWLGPKVISRWGPSFNANGQYSNPSNDPVTGDNNPQNWQGQTLVDLIVDSTPSPNNDCPTSPTNWSPNPAVASRTGFYACIDPSGRIADIHLSGKLTDAYANSRTPLDVSTKAFARPYNPTFTVNSGSSSSSGNGGTLTITQPSTLYFEVLGGGVTCGAGGAVIPTTTTINVTAPAGATATPNPVAPSTKALNLLGDVGTNVTVTGTALSTFCVGSDLTYNSATNNGTQVLTLRNGDTPPLFAPLPGQPPIDAFLTKYLDSATGKVKLAENQVIYLFELDTTTNPSAAYDMQDLVVLATITPKAQ